MTPSTKSGVTRPKLQAPDIRRLREGAMVLKQIAVLCSNDAERDDATKAAELVETKLAQYSPKAKADNEPGAETELEKAAKKGK